MLQRVSFICFVSFVALACLELSIHLIGLAALHLLVKPLLMPTLLGYFWAKTVRTSVHSKKFVVLALVFSFLGDTSLMFEQQHNLYFVVGLAMFLLAHIFYVVFFIRSSKIILWAKMQWIILAVLAYGAGLMFFLSPHLGQMRIAVWIYALTIMTMLLFSYNFYVNYSSGIWVFWGALLFVLSDSLIAIDKFALKIPLAQFLIMLTYIAAQWYIVKGILQTAEIKQ